MFHEAEIGHVSVVVNYKTLSSPLRRTRNFSFLFELSIECVLDVNTKFIKVLKFLNLIF